MPSPQRRAAVIGGNRIPFARAHGAYAGASNQEMLTAALEGLVARHGLAGERVGEVVAGAVLKHSRDYNLTRESVLGSSLAATTPAFDVQQACGTGLEATILVANKVALGQIESGIAGGTDSASDAPVAVSEGLRQSLLAFNRARTTGERLRALGSLRPGHLVPSIPQNTEPRTGLSMGEHMAQTASQWSITRRAQDELAAASHHNLAAAYERGFLDDLLTPFHGLTRDATLRPDTSVDQLAKLRPVFGTGEDATMTAGNSTPLTDGASTVLLGSDSYRRPGPAGPCPPRRRRDGRGRLRRRQGGNAHGPGPRPSRGCSSGMACASRTSTSSRSMRPSPRPCSPPWRPGERGVLPRPARPRRPHRRPRPQPAQRRRLARGRASLRRHRWPDRRVAGEAAARAGHRGPGLISICAAGGQGVLAILEAALIPGVRAWLTRGGRGRRAVPGRESRGHGRCRAVCASA